MSDSDTAASQAGHSSPGELQRRKSCILNQMCCVFQIADNPSADSSAPWYELGFESKVGLYSSYIETAAKSHALVPDLIRAIMYIETTHGYYDFPLDWIGENKSILPMNINVSFWGDTFGSRDDMHDPVKNIQAGAELLWRISACVPPPQKIEYVATLYNNLGATKVSNYGARTASVYRAKPWASRK